MMARHFLVIASISALTVAGATMGGCSVTTTDTVDDDDGSSSNAGSGGSSTSTGGSGGGTTTAGGGDATGGSGGGGEACQGCAEAAADPADPEDPYANVCGYNAVDDSCDAGSSCEKLELLGDCLCTEDPLDSPCADECDVSCGYCDPGTEDCLEVEDGCQTCTLVGCMVEAGACLNDV